MGTMNPQRVFRVVSGCCGACIFLMLIFLYTRPLSSDSMAGFDNLAQAILPMPMLGVVIYSLYRTWSTRTSLRAFWQAASAPLLMTAAVITDLTGQIIWLVYAQLLHQPIPTPSIADIAYLMTDPLLLVGILCIRTHAKAQPDRGQILLDCLSIMTALTTFSWYFILGPTLAQGNESVLGKLINAAYPLCDLLLVCCLLLVSLRRSSGLHNSVALALLVGGCAVLSVDLVFAYQTLQGTYVTGELIDVLWPLGDMGYLIAIHALVREQPQQLRPDESERPATPPPQLWVAVLPYLLLPAIGLLVWYIFLVNPSRQFDGGVYLGSALLLCLILLRQILALRKYHHQLRQEKVLKQQLQFTNAAMHEKQAALLQANAELSDLRDVLAQQNEELRSANKQLEALAITDPLTGLYNHRYFQEILNNELTASASQSLPVSVLMLDIDHFRQFNESYGHDVGDRVLKAVAQHLQQSTHAGVIAARYGGEEFVLILPGANGLQAQAQAERIRKAIANMSVVLTEQPLQVTVSIGCACFPLHASVATSLLKAADLALYYAKRHGRNRVSGYDPEMFEHQSSSLIASATLSLPSGADMETVQALITAIDLRDGYTAAHSEGVARNAVAIGTALGLSSEAIEALRLGGLVHDVGKIGVPDGILRKPNALTPEEWQKMQEHTVMGEQILRSVESLHHLIPLTRSHHERLDGTGYPDGLQGDAISFLVRIMSVADVFDAYTGERPYHTGRSIHEGLQLLHEEVSLGRLDGVVVAAFAALLDRQQVPTSAIDLKAA